MENTYQGPVLSQVVRNEEKIKVLEEQVNSLYKQHKSILEQFREMIAAVTEISEESSEE